MEFLKCLILKVQSMINNWFFFVEELYQHPNGIRAMSATYSHKF